MAEQEKNRQKSAEYDLTKLGQETPNKSEKHEIEGKISLDDGSPLPGAWIEVFHNQKLIHSAQSDQEGYYRIEVRKAGQYLVVTRPYEGSSDAESETVKVNSVARHNTVFPRSLLGGGGGGSRAAGGGGVVGGGGLRAVDDLATFPILTEEVSFPSARPAAPGSPSGTALSDVIEIGIRDILGWKPRASDPKGFEGALTQAFTLKDVEGHIEYEWNPRTYVVQTDLSGGVTGAQASLYSRSDKAMIQALPLLDGLYALRLDADPQDVMAIKAVVRNQMQELVKELALPGGPRVIRVDQLFNLLLGADVNETNPDEIEGQLGTLRREFGLRMTQPPAGDNEDWNLVNNVEEEQNLTNYRILSDYLTSLRISWQNNRNFFLRPPQPIPFFGTQLVLLSRQLAVVAESVEEVRFTMDSVFIGPAERQTLQLDFPAGVTLPRRPPARPFDVTTANVGGLPAGLRNLFNNPNLDQNSMFVEELLTWITNFAQQEGPYLVKEGGKYAVQESFLPVVVTLRNLSYGALIPTNAGLPRGYRSDRVRRAWRELANQLDELAFLANPIAHQIPSQD